MRILIVVDMQKDFINGSLGSRDAEAIVEAAVNKINGFNGDIIVTLDTHFENYMETSEGKNLPIPHCIKDTDGWQLDSRIRATLDKKAYSAVEKITFGSVELPKIIAENYDINNIEIELIGLCTDICVVSNALLLKAHFPEIPIFVDSSCCAGVTPKSHNAALETMRSCQINVI